MAKHARARDRIQVLLVDDQPAHLLLLEAVLDGLGATLVRAGCGEEALKAVSASDFAVVLMDVRMPVMGGFEAARRMRELPRSRLTPIIFVTADSAELNVDEAYAFGAVDILAKPISPAVVRAKVSFFIELFRSQQALATERAFLSAVLESVEDGIVACDADGVLTLFNRASHAFHGQPAKRLPAQDWAAHYGLFEVDGCTPLAPERIPLARALAGERLRGVKLVIVPKKGPPHTVVASGGPLADKRGRRLGAVVSMHDLTAREQAKAARQASRELRAANEQLWAIFEQAPAFMCLLRGPEHVFELANERYVQLVGQPELLGRRVVDALPEMQSQGFVHLLDEVYRSGTPYAGTSVPVLLRREPGGPVQARTLDFAYVPMHDGEGRVSGILVHGVDQTERQRAQDSLFASQERYRALFEAVDEGFCLIEMLFDAAGQPVDYRFLETNPAFVRHTGLEGAIGRTVREMVPAHEEHWFRIYGEVVATGRSVRFVDEAQGLARWYDVYATRVGGEGSRTVAVLFNDITERKRNEDELRRLAAELSEADRRKNEFLATLAHELRNPLAPLRNGLQVMRLAADNPAAVTKAQDMMERQLGHMVHLVNDLLDVARIGRGKLDLRLERVALKTVVASAVETSLPLIEQGRHALRVEVPDEPLALNADPVRLAQVLGNLLNNAAKYTPAGGQIELRVWREGEAVRVCVTDNGIGLAPESLAKVFEMFTQVGEGDDRVQGGLGIGLSLVQRLVALHGGTVWADSDGPGRGSRFSVRLPLAAAERPTPGTGPGPGLPQPGDTRRLRVLVVDDNLDAAESLSILLQLGGHAVAVAANAATALQLAPGLRPEAVFLDIGLPDGDGCDLARRLRALPQTAHALLIALTGWGTDEDRARSRAAGFDHHLTKPADPQVVERLLAGFVPRGDPHPSPLPQAGEGAGTH